MEFTPVKTKDISTFPFAAVESPYSGKGNKEAEEIHVKYAQACCKHVLTELYCMPLASHLYFTQFLDDEIPSERKLGISAGFVLAEEYIRYVFVFIDFGISEGMQDAITHWSAKGIPIYCMRLPIFDQLKNS